MDAFVSRKRRRTSDPKIELPPSSVEAKEPANDSGEEESTDFKLALLASLHPDLSEELLLEALLSSEGSVEQASNALKLERSTSPRKRFARAKNGVGYQASLRTFNIGTSDTASGDAPKIPKKPSTKKGTTLHLYDPKDIEAHTPCSIIHNFLPPDQADALLKELLDEVPTFWRDEFKLFDRIVTSPHSFCFYVDNWDEVRKQKTEYVYNGGPVKVS